MSDYEKIRLFKIASEINIGRDAIVQFLQQKGFNLENKPTALLTEDMVEAIYDKFKREKKAAEKQREKVEKLKALRKPIEIKKSPEFEKEEEKPEELPFEDRKPVMPVETESLLESPVPELEILEEPLPEVIQKPEIISEISEPVVTKPLEEVKPTEIETLSEVIMEQKTITVPVESVIPQSKIIEEVLKEIDEKLEDISELGTESLTIDGSEIAPAKKSKKRKKRKKVIEVEYEIGETPKLKGLTIVGKINLDAGKEIKLKLKDKKVKVLDNEEEDEEFIGIKSKVSKLKKKSKVKGKAEVKDVTKEKITDKKKRKKKSVREMITEEDVDKAIRETMSGMGESTGAARSRLRQRKRLEREEKEMKIAEEKEREANVLQLSEFVTTSDLAGLMNVNANEIILKCMGLGLMVSINQRLDKDTIIVIADDYGMQVEFLDEKAIQYIDDFDDPQECLKPRSPIVTIMGHVDHGKTSLLDFIRKANVVAGEAGGITQHIGAYRVALHNDKSITFLDTPGHEAFTAMRARGALVTDIVVLVVAADDSVMPQTIEAISHAQAANVPIIVAINKIDKPDSKPDRIKQQLADHGVLVEDWGGKNQSVEISAKFGQNVELLLEKILLEAEILELKANSERRARGSVIEAKMDKGLGNLSTIIVQKGTLKTGDSLVVGSVSGRVRAMFDERGNKLNTAGPSIPVRIIGLEGLPEAGDIFVVAGSEQEARAIASQRKQLRREQDFRQLKHVTLDDISKQISLGGIKELNLIIKGDVSGSVEALSDSLQKLSRDEVRVVILHKGVGSISESDVMLAVASGAVIIGFQVSMTNNARKLIDKEGVDVRLYSIIYDCINEVKLALEGLLSPDVKEDVTSTIEVRKVFKISKQGVIAGCYVTSGKVSRNDRVRVLRDGIPVYNGSIHSLKRNKDDVKDVETGYECGIMLSSFNEVEPGDIIEGYKIVETKRTFS